VLSAGTAPESEVTDGYAAMNPLPVPHQPDEVQLIVDCRLADAGQARLWIVGPREGRG
jgi:hypothetical protein